MEPKILLDYELAVSQSGYVVRALLKLEGRAPSAATAAPLNLSVVLDRSGSMAAGKLEAASDAAALLVRRLRSDDVVSVVAFDDEVLTVAPPATGREQADLPARIRALEPGGSTNLSGGWLRGHEFVSMGRARAATDGGSTVGDGAAAPADRRMHRVLLLTDGQANVGIADPARLVGIYRKARATGVSTTTIGFGADYDEHLLRAMAESGGGNAYYIERPDQAPGVFEEEIEGLLSIAAQNAVVAVAPSNAVQLVAVRHRYPSTETAHGVRVELGDLYAREPKALLLEFFVPALGAAPGVAVPIADVAIDAYVLTEDGGLERREVRFPIAAPLDATGHQEPEVRREAVLLEAARAREAALAARERGDYAGASAAIAAVAPMMEALSASDGDVREDAADLTAMQALFEAGAVTSADAKYIGQRAYNADRRKTSYQAKLRRYGRGERPRCETNGCARLSRPYLLPRTMAAL